MKRCISLAAALCLVATLFSGCSNWLEGTYQSITPHQNKDIQSEKADISIATYGELRRHLESAVESGGMSGTIHYGGIDTQTAQEYMDVALRYMKLRNAVYAYAVKDVAFNFAEANGNIDIAYEITYHHGRSEVLRIQRIETMDDASNAVYTALEQISDHTAVMTDHYSSLDFKQLVHDYAEQNPSLIMETPQINVRVYPDSGEKRVIALDFTYQTHRETLLKMRSETEQVFLSADIYIKGATQVSEIYSRLYSFIMERYDDYTLNSSVTPAYSLLLGGTGDSHAFAVVYARMCKNANLSCSVITGTKDGVPWSWNLVRIRDTYYHVDLVECKKNAEFRMLTSAEMDGYTWDVSSYSAQ